MRSVQREDGFTLIETLVVAALISLAAALSTGAYAAYNKSAGHSGAVRETVAMLRNAQVKAVTDAATIECRFTNTKLEIHGTSGLIKEYTLDSNLQFVWTGTSHGVAHGFTHPDATPGHNNCFLYPRGSATQGVVGVKRVDSAKEFDIKLESLTSRVSYCEDPAANPCL